VSQLRAALSPDFTILSGDDALTLPFMAVGAKGVISVVSNFIPREISHMIRAWQMGKPAIALKIHEKYYQLFRDVFAETNPLGAKAAMAMMGLIEEELRLPMTPMSAKNREKLRTTMKACGILK